MFPQLLGWDYLVQGPSYSYCRTSIFLNDRHEHIPSDYFSICFRDYPIVSGLGLGTGPKPSPACR